MSKTKPPVRQSTAGTKRKHEDTQTPSNASNTTDQPSKKSRPEQTETDPKIPFQTPTDLSKKFTLAIKKHNPNLTTIELEDQSFPPSCFKDTTSFSSPRLVQNLLDFLDQNTDGGIETLKKCDEKATPHTLLFTSSAIRCTDLLRAVRPLGTESSKIAKLFAKHMKLPVMEQYVRTTSFGVAAGTPARVLDLVKGGALRLEGLKRVVLDASYVDEKKRVLIDDKETFLRIVEFLNLEEVKGRLVKGDVEILVF